jgi:hypothetical protein
VCSEFSDVWSFGITVWEIFEYCQKVPYWKIEDGNQVKDLVTSGKGPSEIKQPEKCSNQIWGITEKCWLQNPSDRPTFLQLLQKLQVLHIRKPSEVPRPQKKKKEEKIYE